MDKSGMDTINIDDTKNNDCAISTFGKIVDADT